MTPDLVGAFATFQIMLILYTCNEMFNIFNPNQFLNIATGMEHWLGLKTVYKYTNYAHYSLRVSLEDQGGNKAEVVYQNFKLDIPVISDALIIYWVITTRDTECPTLKSHHLAHQSTFPVLI